MAAKLNLAILNKKKCEISSEEMRKIKAGVDDCDDICKLLLSIGLCEDFCTIEGDSDGEYNYFVYD